MNSISEEQSVWKDRLLKVQTAVHKATEEAWKQSSTSPKSTVLTDSDNASFLLGMDLFGQDVSVLERQVRDKLQDVEHEWKKLLAMAANKNHRSVNVNGDDGDDDDDLEDSSDDLLGPQELEQQAKIYQQKIDFLKEASWARSCLDESQTLASSLNHTATTETKNALVQASQQLIQALQHVSQAQEIVQNSPTSPKEQQVAHQILESLRHAIRRHRVEMVHKACNVLDSSITFSANALSSKGVLQLEAAFQVLEELEGGHSALETTLRQMTLRLYNQVLSPLLDPHRTNDPETTTTMNGPWKVVESEKQGPKGLIGVSTTTNKGPAHRLEWHREESSESSTATTAIAAWKDTLSVLQAILSFVQSKILLKRSNLCQVVGNRLFGKPNALPSALNLHALRLDESIASKTLLVGQDNGILMEELVEWISKTCLPNYLDPSQIVDTLNTSAKELLSMCSPFCTSLVEQELLPRIPPPKLVLFCQKYHHHYIENRRCVLLNEARDVLLNNDYHNTIQVGVDVDKDADNAIFQLHRSSVSDTAFKIMALVRKAMDEMVAMTSVLSSEERLSRLRPTLYRAAREMLSLFRAIIPASHGSEVRHVPRTAALLQNDCIFLAHHCLTLGLEYKELLGEEGQDDEQDVRGKLLQQTCIFVDMVPLFRELADTSMGDMLDLQKHQLAEIVGARIVYFGQSLPSDESLQEWSEAETAMAAGIYHLRHLSQAWKPILSRRVFESSMGYLSDVIFTLYLQQLLGAKGISPSASQFTSAIMTKAREEIGQFVANNSDSEMPEDCSSEWERFGAVQKFLDMTQLEQVEAALAHGTFKTLVSQEMVRLIQAKCGDSPERRALLNALASV